MIALLGIVTVLLKYINQIIIFSEIFAYYAGILLNAKLPLNNRHFANFGAILLLCRGCPL